MDMVFYYGQKHSHWQEKKKTLVTIETKRYYRTCEAFVLLQDFSFLVVNSLLDIISTAVAEQHYLMRR
jgi:hypothetical protein